MIAEITAAATGLKTISELATLLVKMNVDSRVTEKAIELQSTVIDVQSSMLALQSQHQSLLREKDELETHLIKMENWEAEAQQYTLTEMVQGVFVYALKEDYKGTTPPHWVCPHCYQDKKKSILQFEQRPGHGNVFRCPHCGLILTDHSNNAMPS